MVGEGGVFSTCAVVLGSKNERVVVTLANSPLGLRHCRLVDYLLSCSSERGRGTKGRGAYLLALPHVPHLQGLVRLEGKKMPPPDLANGRGAADKHVHDQMRLLAKRQMVKVLESCRSGGRDKGVMQHSKSKN